jgi:hypothetical protein
MSSTAFSVTISLADGASQPSAFLHEILNAHALIQWIRDRAQLVFERYESLIDCALLTFQLCDFRVLLRNGGAVHCDMLLDQTHPRTKVLLDLGDGGGFESLEPLVKVDFMRRVGFALDFVERGDMMLRMVLLAHCRDFIRDHVVRVS